MSTKKEKVEEVNEVKTSKFVKVALAQANKTMDESITEYVTDYLVDNINECEAEISSLQSDLKILNTDLVRANRILVKAEKALADGKWQINSYQNYCDKMNKLSQQVDNEKSFVTILENKISKVQLQISKREEMLITFNTKE